MKCPLRWEHGMHHVVQMAPPTSVASPLHLGNLVEEEFVTARCQSEQILFDRPI